MQHLDKPPKLYIADGLYGLGKHPWDSPDKKWKKANYKQVFELAQASQTNSPILRCRALLYNDPMMC